MFPVYVVIVKKEEEETLFTGLFTDVTAAKVSFKCGRYTRCDVCVTVTVRRSALSHVYLKFWAFELQLGEMLHSNSHGIILAQLTAPVKSLYIYKKR